MLNQYPLWKYLLIVVIITIGALYASPNIYGTNPALQIAARKDQPVDSSLQKKVVATMQGAEIPFKSVVLDSKGLLIRFDDVDAQLRATEKLDSLFHNDYIIAKNIASAAPEWMASFNALPMYLGLDLRGGLHFLMEVDMETAMGRFQNDRTKDIRSLLRENKMRGVQVQHHGKEGGIKLTFASEAQREKASLAIRREFTDTQVVVEDVGGKYALIALLKEESLRDVKKQALQQNVTTLRNRVNEIGVAEPVIQQQGEDRIVVQLPGIQDSVRAKEILSATASLEFRMADPDGRENQALAGRVPFGMKLYQRRGGGPILLRQTYIITGDNITHANSGLDQDSGSPAVFINLDGPGARIMGQTTKRNLKKPMAVVFIEHKTDRVMVNGKQEEITRKVEEVINVATIQGVFSKRFQITGLDSPKEAQTLALLLRAGALKAPIKIVEERTIGPSLGADNIAQGLNSILLGLALVVAFMVFWYRGFGLVANAALAANMILIVAVLSMLQATLTLPGIAGIILTVGMAVDANVLIFERIREELRAGNTPQSSINAGYEKALSTIADANITTFIAAVVLYIFGTGPIRGFAITLSIGIVTSMFTAIMGTRAIVNTFVGGKRIKTLSI